MNRFLTLSLLVFSSLALAVDAGDPAPGWKRFDLNGTLVTYPPVNPQRQTVVIFWATWCPYCRVLMPYLADIQSDYGKEGVQIMAINMKETDDARAYIKSSGYDFVTILDGDDVAKDYSVEYLPGLFVVDADGTVLFRRTWTELPAGRQVAELWDAQVRAALGPVD